MIPVTVAKIMVPASGTKIAQHSQNPWFITARIKNCTETPTTLRADQLDTLASVGDNRRNDRRRAEGGRPQELVDRDQNSCGQQPW